MSVTPKPVCLRGYLISPHSFIYSNNLTYGFLRTIIILLKIISITLTDLFSILSLLALPYPTNMYACAACVVWICIFCYNVQ